MNSPLDNRRRERKAHRTKLILSLDSGPSLSGFSDNVSLNGLLLTSDAPFEGAEIGMSGKTRAEPDYDNLSLSCRVARIKDYLEAEAGFLRYLSKPIKVTEITEAIEFALGSRAKT